MNAGEYNHRLLDVVRAIGAAEDAYREAIARAANSERAYRRREAIASQTVRGGANPPKNQSELSAMVELLEFKDGATVGDLRYQRDLDKGMMDVAKQVHRAKVGEMSALQSEASLSRAEAEFIRTGPETAP